MKSFKIASMLLFAVFALSMISGASAAHVNGTHVVPVNKTIQTHVNDKFTIKLASNPSTGYGWALKYNHKFLKLVNITYIPSNSNLAGASGVQVYVFKAIKQGNPTIDLKYLRSWEKHSSIKELVYHVKITK